MAFGIVPEVAPQCTSCAGTGVYKIMDDAHISALCVACGGTGVQERIRAAALLINERIISLPPPARHHHLIRAAQGLYTDYVTQQMQGFVTSQWRFVTREEAMVIARAQGQLIPRKSYDHVEGVVSEGDRLFSEDLW